MSVSNLKDAIADCIDKLRVTSSELDFCHTQVVQSFAKEMNCKIVSMSEYDQLKQDAVHTASEIKAKVDKELAVEVKILNSQLQHEIDKIRLTKDAEIDVLKTKLEYVNKALEFDYQRILDHFDHTLKLNVSNNPPPVTTPEPTSTTVAQADDTMDF